MATSCSRESIFSNSGTLLKGHGDVVGGGGRVSAGVGLVCVDLDPDQEFSATLRGNIDSRSIADGRCVSMPLARDPLDDHALGHRIIVRQDIGALPPACLFNCQDSRNSAKQIISGIGAAHRSVRVEYKIAAGVAAQERAEAGSGVLCYRQGRERDLERR